MKLINNDCVIAMKEMPDNSVDSIVTDPPYELGFMGKSWDSTGIAFNIEVWQEALRVLKPGGHLIAFSGSRTYHRMAVAIEDAGFQIRDQIMWIYGSGFPKSHNISKGIDKSDAVELRRQRDLKFTEWVRSTGMKARQIDDITESNMGGHYLTDKEQPTVATAEMFNKLRPFLPEVPEWVEQMVRERTIESENYKKREVVGKYQTDMGGLGGERLGDAGGNITTAATHAAKQWDGWGTALKPAHEPMVLARKPLVGTVANNVLTYGVGGLNIDGGRVGTETRENQPAHNVDGSGWGMRDKIEASTVQGRFPANIIHDGSDEVSDLLGEPARFFYCAKASKKDRNEGLDKFKPKKQDLSRKEGNPGGDNPRNRGVNERLNHHPTVKPTSLMQYLVRLVTPPNGIVLDPFMGSGSTGKACAYEGFDFIGIEMSAEYIEIAKARIAYAQNESGNENQEG